MRYVGSRGVTQQQKCVTENRMHLLKVSAAVLFAPPAYLFSHHECEENGKKVVSEGGELIECVLSADR